LKVFDVEIKLEVEYIDLNAKQVGVICFVTKGARGKATHIALPVPQNVLTHFHQALAEAVAAEDVAQVECPLLRLT